VWGVGCRQERSDKKCGVRSGKVKVEAKVEAKAKVEVEVKAEIKRFG